MNITGIQPQVDASDVPINELLGDKRLTRDQKIGEASRLFEALLLRQILASTQKTVIKSEFTDNSTASSIYQDLITRQLADDISKSGTLGLAKMLQHQLTLQLDPASAKDHQGSAGSSVAPAARPESAPVTAAAPAPKPDFSTKGAALLKSHE